jgi:hypothetical protein
MSYPYDYLKIFGMVVGLVGRPWTFERRGGKQPKKERPSALALDKISVY